MPNSSEPTSTGDMGDVKNGPLAKAGQSLIGVYLDYQDHIKTGETRSFSSKRGASVLLDGIKVGVMIQGTNMDELVATLMQHGMQIKASDSHRVIVEGFLPIHQLPQVTQSSKVATISPIYRPGRM